MLNGRAKKLAAAPAKRAQLREAVQRISQIKDPSLRAAAQARVRNWVQQQVASAGNNPTAPNATVKEAVRGVGRGTRRYTPSWS